MANQVREYRLLFGRVWIDHPDDLQLPPHKRREAMYGAGQRFKSDQDLLRLNGAAGDARKIELIHDAPPPYNPRAWDPEKESLDDFVARMRGFEEPEPEQPAPDEPAPVSDLDAGIIR